MANMTTPTSSKGLHLDVQGYAPAEIIPEALIVNTSTISGHVDGDEPAVRVPFINADDDAGFVDEGSEIPEGDPDQSEVIIHTGKVAVLEKISREQFNQGEAAGLLSEAVRRAILRKANRAYLAQPKPTVPKTTPPAGLLELAPTSGGTIATDLDVLADTIMAIEAANGTATHIIASPTAWASLTKLKTATASNQTIVGADVNAATRQLLSVPVLVTTAMTDNQILVLDKEAVLSVVGDVELTVSDQTFFSSDSYGIRCTFRFGQQLVDPARVVTLTVTDPSA